MTAASQPSDLAAAYFVPDTLTFQALLDALKRGVRLRIVVPGEHIDSDAVRGALSRSIWGPLLSVGATEATLNTSMRPLRAPRPSPSNPTLRWLTR